MKNRLTAIILAMACYFNAFAETFIVTSNADSGPGTLREAITLANTNGTASFDYIHFNIPETSFNLRIIKLVSELPALTSNITIDGSTQPGERYAVTDAKICLKKDEYAGTFSLLKLENATNINIYGLYLYYGYWQGFFSIPSRSNLLYGINIIKASNIKIGAPGKGNVINGVVHGIYSNSESCSNIFIKSNFIGHGRYYDNQNDDIDIAVLGVASGITLSTVKDITIGGTDPEEGNIFGGRMRGLNIDSRNTSGNGFLKILNNIFGRNFDKTTLIQVSDFWDAYIKIGRSRNNPADYSGNHEIDYRIELLDNDIPNHVQINYVSDSIIVKRNTFNEDQRAVWKEKLSIRRCSKGGIIGDESIINGNSFKSKNFWNYYYSMAIIDSGPFTILKNTFQCNSVFGSTTLIYHWNNLIPFVQIDQTTAGSVLGRATANAKIDLYYDDNCTACEGETYIATVMADASGNWKYSGSITGTVVAIATTSKGYSSEFSKPTFDETRKLLKHPTCGKNNGSITGINAEGADEYFWTDYRTKDTVSRSIDLENVGTGAYLLHAIHGGTCINVLGTFNLEDVTPTIRKDWTTITQPSCGQDNGAIYGLIVWNHHYFTYKWVNSRGETIGTNFNINRLAEGTYTFIVTDTTVNGGCIFSETFVLSNQSGPTLHTDDIKITNATCSKNSGSIKGITVTNTQGISFIQWIDSLNKTVSNSLDLVDVFPGKYRLKFKDAGGCDTIITPFYTVGNIGEIKIDASGKLVGASKCSGISGSIRNIKVHGGTSYQWKNTSTNTVVGTTLDVSDLPGGNYQLTVFNNEGCNNKSAVIHVPQAEFKGIGINQFVSKMAFCGLPNGSLEPQSFTGDSNYYSFRWVDSTNNQNISNYTNAFNIYGGTYLLFVKDSNNCEANIFKTVLKNAPVPTFNYSNIAIAPDVCLGGKGAISGITVNNLISGTTQYTWQNNANETVGNSIAAKNLAVGDYQLKITDAMGCTVISNTITVNNININLTRPIYDNITILKNTAAVLKVKNLQQGVYELYEDPSALPVASNSTGIFTTQNLSADKIYYIRFVQGICFSTMITIKVTVVDKTAIYVPTAFTPNWDGKNDVLRITAHGAVKLHYFTIFNRYGQNIFTTTSFNNEWNGTFKDKQIESGVYVWILKATDELTGRITEQKGTVTIIR